MIFLELAKESDAKLCLDILTDGRAFQREQGFVQWGDNYPNADTVRSDIEKKIAYIIRVDENAAGYLCVDFNGDPEYSTLEGEWANDEPYAVVHRLAISSLYRNMGLADKTFSLVEDLCLERGVHTIRVDTDFPNKRMQHIVTKKGFVERGIVTLTNGRRIAYDKTF